MADWTDGYMAEVDYTYGYYLELNPLRVKLAFLNAGHAFPSAGVACELGFGQGVSTNIHAAASVTRWYGTDFNPAQAGFARELAQAAGAQAQLYDDAFDVFCARDDLPDFDFIGLHGIWSWISEENRAVIVDFIRRKLKVGGVLYISYNTQPGWAAMAPVRDLMADYAATMGAPGQGIVPRVDAALGFVQKLLESGAAFGAANPIVAKRFEAIRKQDRHYLAHVYFNQHWTPQSFASISRQLGEAKLGFACSANLLDHVDPVNLTPEQMKLLGEIHDRNLRETVRDFLVNQQFRRDYWVRGVRSMPLLERAEILRAQRFVLGMPRADIKLTVKGALGEARMQDAIYMPILDLMGDYRVRTLAEIEQAMAPHGVELNQLMQAVIILAGNGALYPANDAAVADAAAERTASLNRALCRRARSTQGGHFLASPVTGGGIAVSRFEQMFLLARAGGARAPADWAAYAAGLLRQQGEQVLLDGKPFDSVAAQLAELERQAESFRAERLPILQALRVVD